MKDNRKHLILVLLAVSIVMSACNGNRVFEEYIGFERLSWADSDTVIFELDGIKDTSAITTISIRYNDDYEFHNLYVRFHLLDSLGTLQVDSLVNLQLFESTTGHPLGEGFGNRRTLHDTLPIGKIPLQSKIKFIQYMRRDSLNGIEAVGLKVMQP